MTDYPDASEAMTQLFSDVWTPSGFLFALGNDEFDPPVDSPWARMVIKHNGAPQKTLGRPTTRKFDRLGSMFIQVFTPQREGTRRSSELIQRVVDGFEGARISGTSICFNDVIPREVGPTDHWYQVTIECEFRYTDIK